MAAQRPEPEARPLPLGLRSGPMDWRDVGLWRPLMAISGALLLPALVAWGLVALAGAPGALDGQDWLRGQILLTLYALAMAPVAGLFALPLLWPLVLVAAVRGWAGLGAAVVMALTVGLSVVHVALHGDLTTETGAILPNLVCALALQGLTGWAVFWSSMRHSHAKAARITRTRPRASHAIAHHLK